MLTRAIQPRKRRSQDERGIALLTALFALLLISGIAVGMMFMANTETAINYNYREMKRAEYAALAGIQEARARMMVGVANPVTPPSVLPTTTAGVVYLRNPRGSETIDPTDSSNAYFDRELCHEKFPGLNLSDSGANVPCAVAAPTASVTYIASNSGYSPGTATNYAMAYKWVRITQKNNVSAGADSLGGSTYPHAWKVTGSGATALTTQICWDGTRQVPLPADGRANCDADPPGGGTNYYRSVHVVTALAVTQSGARKMMQGEVALTPPLVTNAAVDTNDFITVQGSSVTINGYDNCQCECTVGSGNAPPHCDFRGTNTPCTGSTYAIYTSQDVRANGGPAIVAGTSPAVAENQPWNFDVTGWIENFKNAPGLVPITGPPYNQTCTTSGSPAVTSCGNMTDAEFGWVPGGSHYSGDPWPPDTANPPRLDQYTYVPGNIELRAHSNGSGVLIVDGDLTINGGLNFYGLILVKGTVTFIGGGSGQDTNVIGSILAGQSGITDNTLGGGVNIQFDRCALLHNLMAAPPRKIAIRDLSY